MFGVFSRYKKEKQTNRHLEEFKEARQRAVTAMVTEEVGFHNGHALSLPDLLQKFGVPKQHAKDAAWSMAVLYDREMHTEWCRLFDIAADLNPGARSRAKRLKWMQRTIFILCCIWFPLWIVALTVQLFKAFT